MGTSTCRGSNSTGRPHTAPAAVSWRPACESRTHTRVSRGEGGFIVEDLGSTNGSFVNGNPVTRQPLQPGDLIRIGNTVLRFCADASR